jgi:hypothetical protein
MGLFNRQPVSNTRSPAWTPTVDMATAGPVVFALADYPSGNDARNAAALATFVRLSGRPSTEQLIKLIASAPSSSRDSVTDQLLNRPWTWLAAVMRQAASAGDHHLVLMGLWWACYWTSDLLPRNNNIGALEELGLCPIARSLKTEILSLGLASADQLPAEFVVAGDETGHLTAGKLADVAAALLQL